MKRFPTTVFALVLLSTALALQAALAQNLVMETEDRRTYAAEGEFSFYREMVESAITDEGMVVNYVGHIASMLDRTGGDLGAGESLYLHGESLEFCSALYSRRMMEADPHSIVYCPYVIAVYELAAEPGTVYVGYQRLPKGADEASEKALRDVEELIDRIVNNALAF